MALIVVRGARAHCKVQPFYLDHLSSKTTPGTYILLHSPSLVVLGLLLAGITLLWLADVNIVWDCLSCNGLWAHMTSGNFLFFIVHWQSPFTAVPANYDMFKETVKQSWFNCMSSCQIQGLTCRWWLTHWSLGDVVIFSNFKTHIKNTVKPLI